MTLSDIRTKASISATERTEAAIEKLRVEGNIAKVEADTARSAYEEALCNLAEGTGDTSAVSKLKRAFDTAQDRANSLAVACEAAQRRLIATKAAEAAAALRKQWDKAIEIADNRQNALAELAAAAKIFAEYYHKTIKLNAELFSALPNKPDLDAAFMRVEQIEILVRKELQRLGVAWAFDYPWKAPEMLDEVAGVAGLIRSWQRIEGGK